MVLSRVWSLLCVLTHSQSVFNWFYSVQSSGMRIFCNRYAWYFLMFINFYSVLTVSNLSNMLKCVLLLPSDCVHIRYCNEIISVINKIILQSGGESSIAWWRNVQVAKRLGGEPSRWRNVQGAKRPGANWRMGETSSYLRNAVATVPPRRYYSIVGYGTVKTATQPRMLSLTQKY